MKKWVICVRGLSPFLAKAASENLLDNIRTSLQRPNIGLLQGAGVIVDDIFESRIDLSSNSWPKNKNVILISDRSVTNPDPNFRIFVTSVPPNRTEFLKLVGFIEERKRNPYAATGLVFLSTTHDLSLEIAGIIADFMNGKMESYSQSVADPLITIVPELFPKPPARPN